MIVILSWLAFLIAKLQRNMVMPGWFSVNPWVTALLLSWTLHWLAGFSNTKSLPFAANVSSLLTCPSISASFSELRNCLEFSVLRQVLYIATAWCTVLGQVLYIATAWCTVLRLGVVHRHGLVYSSEIRCCTSPRPGVQFWDRCCTSPRPGVDSSETGVVHRHGL